MQNRECPYCHKRISIGRCLIYMYRGTNYSTRCNHCERMVKLKKEPISFVYCVCAGFLSIYLPMQFFLYFCDFPFFKSALFSLPIGILCVAVCILLTFKNIIFQRNEE